MSQAPLVTTSTEGLRPLGTAAQRSFELVTGTIRARLGAEHAALFGEPVATDHGDMIDWYAPIAGEATPLPSLSPEDQDRLRTRLGELVADIRAEADTLAASDDAQDQRLSEALRNAIEVPGEAMIFALRDDGGALHPVLAHWAWLRDEQQSVRGVLTAMVPRPGSGNVAGAAPMPGATGRDAAPRASGPWWWLILLGWLVLAAILAYIIYLMIAPCGLNPGRLTFCAAPDPTISAIPGEREVLENEIAALEREVTLLDRSCQPTVPIVPSNAPGQGAPTSPSPAPAPDGPVPSLPAFPVPGPSPTSAPAETPEAMPVPLRDAGLNPGGQRVITVADGGAALNRVVSADASREDGSGQAGSARVMAGLPDAAANKTISR